MVATILQSTLYSSHARADDTTDELTPRVQGGLIDVRDPISGDGYQVTLLETSNSHQSEEVMRGFESEIRVDLEKNPRQEFRVMVAMGDGSARDGINPIDAEALTYGKRIAELSPQVALTEARVPEEAIAGVTSKLRWPISYNMTFALIRGAVNTGITMFMLMPRMPFYVALIPALLSGGMSFSIQLYQKPFYDILTNGRLISTYLTRNRYHENPNSIPNKTEEYVRWYISEVLYSLVLQTGMTLVGADASFTNWDAAGDAMNNVFKTAMMALLAQGTWDLAITGTRKRDEYLKVKSERQIEFETSRKLLANAGVAITLMVTSLMHPTPPEITFRPVDYVSLAVGGVGLIAWTRSYLKDRQVYPRARRAPSPLGLACKNLIGRLRRFAP